MAKKKILQRSYKPQINVAALEKYANPFVSGEFSIAVTKRKGGLVKDDDGDLISEEFYVEREPKCSVFTGSANRKIVCFLGGAAKDVFLYVLYKLEYGRDWLWLNKGECMRDCNIRANATFEKGVDELVRYGVLSLVYGYSDVYWINPVFFFHGSRVSKYKDKLDVKYEFDGKLGAKK